MQVLMMVAVGHVVGVYAVVLGSMCLSAEKQLAFQRFLGA